MRKSGALPGRWIGRPSKKAGAQGYLMMWADEKYGGAGIKDFRYEQIMIEENMRYGEPGFFLTLHTRLVGPYLGELGSEEQKARFLPGCVSGEVHPGDCHDRAIGRQRPGGHEDARRGQRRSLAARMAPRPISPMASLAI